MKREFRTKSSFEMKFMQEIKYILYGNVGDYDKFKIEDKKVRRTAIDCRQGKEKSRQSRKLHLTLGGK